jgi:membrane-bound metal-dependent hydrolase YbcI (DUF457 family)
MFIGHFAAGFAAKKIDKRPSLGTLFMAAQFLDLLWPLLLLFGIERVEIDPGNTALTPLNFVYYPFTHGLFGALIWSVLFGGIYYLIRKNMKTAILMGGLVLSHWLLDLIAHRPDLPLFPWSDIKVGLGLWNSVFWSVLLESILFITGVWLYFKATKAKNKKGQIGLWALIIFLGIVYTMNIFGPPPPDTGPVAILGLSQWLLIAWAYWIDRNRISI